jgi:hypothetical protein
MNKMTSVIFQKGDLMKKQLTVALGLAVLATPAFATKARLQALGENVNGSFYVNDNRNVFLNPAQVNNHRDLVTFELGADQGVESTAAPRAEGGVFKQVGNLVWGVQLGAESDTSHAFRAASGGGFLQENNNIDLFVGGDTGLKWGVNLSYTRSPGDDVTGAPAGVKSPSQSALRTRFGVMMGDTQAYGQLNLDNSAENAAGDEFSGNLGYRVGVIHAWNGYSFFGDLQSLSADFDPAAAGAPDREISSRRIEIGAGRVTRLNDRANLFTRVSYIDMKVENEVATGAVDLLTCSGPFACEEYGQRTIPVVVGLEVEATSWLTLRASVSQNLWGKEEDKKNDRPLYTPTTVNAGATLKFGELSIDGVIGNADTAGAIGDNTARGQGTLRTDVLMSRVGMTYRF